MLAWEKEGEEEWLDQRERNKSILFLKESGWFHFQNQKEGDLRYVKWLDQKGVNAHSSYGWGRGT